MPRKPENFPSSVELKQDLLYPDLATAFARWREMGEWPANSIICQFIGGDGANYLNLETGQMIDAKDMETVSQVLIKGQKPRKFYMIFRNPD